MTQDEIIEMARQATGMFAELALMDAWIFDDKSLEAFAKLIAEKEREACAKLCEEPWQGSPRGIAEQIRARGEKA
jgi:hypothetical protein